MDSVMLFDVTQDAGKQHLSEGMTFYCIAVVPIQHVYCSR